MEYYVIYNSNYNVVAYCDNLLEVSKFVNRSFRQLKYKFSKSNCVQVQQPRLLIIWQYM